MHRALECGRKNCAFAATKGALMSLVLIHVSVSLASCRGTCGPSQRVGCEMDRAACKVGGGIARPRHSIQRAAR
jgi:hypothetical protein